MNCKKFEAWLSTRDTRFDDTMPHTTSDHIKDCPQCRDAFEADNLLETQIKKTLTPEKLPKELTARIDSALDHSGDSSFMTLKKVTALVAGLSIILAIVYLGYFNNPAKFQNLQQLSQKAVAKHLEGDWHISFDISDINQGLDMLSKELKFNVILPDLKAEGYALLGGRLCIVGNCRTAYFIYKKDKKTRSLFIMDYDLFEFQMADGSRFNNVVKGYQTNIWKENSQVYAMVD